MRRVEAMLFVLGWLLAGCAGQVEGPDHSMPGVSAQAPTLAQGWSDADRALFYRTPQGTAFYPLAWLMALERPGVPGSRFADPEHLATFGFLKDELPGSEHNLPVGVAVDPDFVDVRAPASARRSMEVVGFTCAACHTGELHYRGNRLRIEGGPAMIELTAFRDALAKATAFALDPNGFERFSARVLPVDASDVERAALRGRLQAFALQRLKQLQVEQIHAPQDPPEGWGRLAALERIGNTVFSPDASIPANLVPINAPVSYPPIWGTPWFAWAQYNASILQPLARNVGEALGVNAGLDLATFESTVRIEDLGRIEALIAGEAFGEGSDGTEVAG